MLKLVDSETNGNGMIFRYEEGDLEVFVYTDSFDREWQLIFEFEDNVSVRMFLHSGHRHP